MCSYPDSYINDLKHEIKEHEERIKYLEKVIEIITDKLGLLSVDCLPKGGFSVPTKYEPYSGNVNFICSDTKKIKNDNIDNVIMSAGFKCANCNEPINETNIRSCDICWDMICKECFDTQRICNACKEEFYDKEKK